MKLTRCSRSVRGRRRKDADAFVRPFADDVVNYDLAPPLAQRGKEATDPTGMREWYATWDGPIRTELGDLTIRTSGELAFCHDHFHMSGKRTDGKHTDTWARSTVCQEKRSGTWWSEKPVRKPGATSLSPDRALSRYARSWMCSTTGAKWLRPTCARAFR